MTIRPRSSLASTPSTIASTRAEDSAPARRRASNRSAELLLHLPECRAQLVDLGESRAGESRRLTRRNGARRRGHLSQRPGDRAPTEQREHAAESQREERPKEDRALRPASGALENGQVARDTHHRRSRYRDPDPGRLPGIGANIHAGASGERRLNLRKRREIRLGREHAGGQLVVGDGASGRIDQRHAMSAERRPASHQAVPRGGIVGERGLDQLRFLLDVSLELCFEVTAQRGARGPRHHHDGKEEDADRPQNQAGGDSHRARLVLSVARKR